MKKVVFLIICIFLSIKLSFAGGPQEFYKAASEGSLEEVKHMLEVDRGLEAKDRSLGFQNVSQALTVAVDKNQYEVAEYLIGQRADVDTKWLYMMEPIFHSHIWNRPLINLVWEKGNRKMLELFIKNEVDLIPLYEYLQQPGVRRALTSEEDIRWYETIEELVQTRAKTKELHDNCMQKLPVSEVSCLIVGYLTGLSYKKDEVECSLAEEQPTHTSDTLASSTHTSEKKPVDKTE